MTKVALVVVMTLSSLQLATNAGSETAAAQKTHPVTEFTALARLAFVECSLSIKIDLLSPDDGKQSSLFPKYTDCRDKNLPQLKTKFQAATSNVSGKAEALSLLKDFYAHWLASIDGLVPQSGEIRMAYNSRTNGNEAELARQAKRIEIELGLE